MLKKVGGLLARLHKIDPEWNTPFRSEAAADMAGIPKKEPDQLTTQDLMCPRTDPVDKTVMQFSIETLLGFDVHFPDEIKALYDKAYLQNEVAKGKNHEVLPKDGW